MDNCANEKKGKSMREGSTNESVVVWKVEVGKGRIRKRSPKGLNRDPKCNHDRFPLYFVFQLTIKETLTFRFQGHKL